MAKKLNRPQKRGARGKGTVFYSESRKCWVARKTVNGHRIERTAKTQAEALRKLEAALPPGPDVALSAWVDRWLSGIKAKPITRRSYRHTFGKHILPTLGSRQVASVTTWDIEVLARDWGESLDGATVRSNLMRFSSCLSAAVRAKLIPANPLSRFQLPKKQRPKFDLFSPDELRDIIELACTRREWYPFAVCAAVGCRIGEAIALEADDYNPATGELSISRTWTRAGVGSPKSESGVRTVHVPSVIRAVFDGKPWPACPYSTAYERWESFLKRLGLRYRNIHQLRHTVASHALAAFVPIGNIARDLGDTVQTIVDTYVHPTPGADVCEAMEKLLGGGKVSSGARNARKTGNSAQVG